MVKGVRTPPSLVNMYKALKIDYPDFVTPNHGYLENWAKQGVLMLNTSLTVEAHKAGSHAKQGWEELTGKIFFKRDNLTKDLYKYFYNRCNY